MSIVGNVREAWGRYIGPKDERVTAEMNRIYRIGFMLLSAAWVALLYYDALLKQVASVHEADAFAAGAGVQRMGFSDPVSFVCVIGTMAILGVIQCRKGIIDEGRFAAADAFPGGYFALNSAFAGLVVLVGNVVLRVLAAWQVTGSIAPADALVGLIMGWFTGVAVFALCMLCFYVSFRAAKKRRDELTAELDDDFAG